MPKKNDTAFHFSRIGARGTSKYSHQQQDLATTRAEAGEKERQMSEMWEYVSDEWGSDPQPLMSTEEVEEWAEVVGVDSLPTWVDRDGKRCMGRDKSGNPLFVESPYNLAVADINSAEIQFVARVSQVTHARLVVEAWHPEHPDSTDWRIRVYELSDGQLVADGNGDPTWEDADAAAWAELMDEYGLEL